MVVSDKARTCSACAAKLVQRERETALQFEQRSTCNHGCQRAIKNRRQRAREARRKAQPARIGGDEFYHRDAKQTVAAQNFLCGYQP